MAPARAAHRRSGLRWLRATAAVQAKLDVSAAHLRITVAADGALVSVLGDIPAKAKVLLDIDPLYEQSLSRRPLGCLAWPACPGLPALPGHHRAPAHQAMQSLGFGFVLFMPLVVSVFGLIFTVAMENHVRVVQNLHLGSVSPQKTL